MKIVIISPAYPLRGGIAHHTASLYKKLCERNYEVYVLTFKRQYPKIFFPGKTQLENSNDKSIKIDTEPIIDSISPLSWWRASRRVKSLSPELVLIMYSMPFFAPCFGTICRLVKKKSHSKVLFLCHNIIPHERRIGDIALSRFAFKRADYFIVQSEVVRQELLKLYPNAKHELVAHPVYDIFGQPVEKSHAKKELDLKASRVLLFFGYVRAYKGLDLLLQAMPAILKKIDLKLLIVGEFYEEELEFRKMIAEMKIDARVEIYPDFVPSEQVNVFFAASDVVVLPYKSATQSGIVQLAYHFNKPCIVTDVGGLAEVVIHEKTGFVVPPNNPRELAAAVIRYYAKDKEQEFSENITVEKKKYSWDNMVDAIEALFLRGMRF